MVLGLNINMRNIENYSNHEAVYLLIDNPHIYVLTLVPHILAALKVNPELFSNSIPVSFIIFISIRIEPPTDSPKT